jgi:hypothetical protein
MNAWTKEPWRADRLGRIDTGKNVPLRQLFQPGDDITSSANACANAQRVEACVNGCAGLNPAAYRECVEAMKRAVRMIPEQTAVMVLERALAHAEPQP